MDDSYGRVECGWCDANKERDAARLAAAGWAAAAEKMGTAKSVVGQVEFQDRPRGRFKLTHYLKDAKEGRGQASRPGFGPEKPRSRITTSGRPAGPRRHPRFPS